MNVGGNQDGAGRCYLGEHEYTVDNQRRIAIPKTWRHDDPSLNHFFLLPGRDKSLQLVPAVTFQELLVKLRRVSFADSKAAIALATIGSMAQECVCDKQGRIKLSNGLAGHAGIVDKVLMLGAITTIQIWSPEIWKQRRMDSESCLDVIEALQERPDDFTEILRAAGR